jgi:hypothetical protein
MIKKILQKFSALISLCLIVFLWQTMPVFAQQNTAPSINSGSGLGASYNWAGYTATDGPFSGVGGSWVVPQPSGSGVSADAAWVGIGGINSNDLIQAGTFAKIDANNQIVYQAFYETLPDALQTIPLIINPGDAVEASLTQQPNNIWQISFRDNTSGQNFQTEITYVSSLSSGEWIEEMPSSLNGRFIPLDNFGTLQFSSLWAIQNGVVSNLSQIGAQPMAMLNSSQQALAQPSALASDGASFSITRTSSSVTQTPAASGRGNWHRIEINIQNLQPFSIGTHSWRFEWHFGYNGASFFFAP